MDKYESCLQKSLVSLIAFLSAVMFDGGALIHLRILVAISIPFYGIILYRLDKLSENPDGSHKYSAWGIIIRVTFGFLAGPAINCVIKNCF